MTLEKHFRQALGVQSHPPSSHSGVQSMLAFPYLSPAEIQKEHNFQEKFIVFKLGPVLISVAKSHTKFLPPSSVLCCEMALSLV